MSDVPHPREVLRGLEQRARRRFGQNFLVEADLAARIVRGAGVQPGDRVIEIGPGLGMLTEELLAAGAAVTAVELDRDLASYLRRRMLPITLVEGDATKVDWAEVAPAPPRWMVVANLPFNVGTVLLMDLVQRRDRFHRVTVMLQKEVVDRVDATPGTKAYGALSVRVAARGTTRQVVRVPAGAFHPPPKVDAAVVRVDLAEDPDFGPAGEAAFDRCVKAAFSQRRKTLANSLAALYGKARAEQALTAAGIDPRTRAERVDVDGFRALAAALDATAAD